MDALNKIRKQFADSIGYTGRFDSKEFEFEFLSWLKARIQLLGDYVILLEDLDLDFMDNNTAEIDKGPFDSVVLPFSTMIITPYVEKIPKYHDSFDLDDRILPGYLEVEYGTPYFKDLFDSSNDSYISNLTINNFMTQNPYDGFDRYKFHELHNTGLYNIILGVYGNTFDKDYDSKINSLYAVKKSLLDSDYLEGFYTFDDKYFYIVASEIDRDAPVYKKTKNKA